MGMAELVARGLHRAKGDGDRLAANHRLVRPQVEHHDVRSQFRRSSEDVMYSGSSQKPLGSIHPPSMTAVRHCDKTPLLKSGADPCQSRIVVRFEVDAGRATARVGARARGLPSTALGVLSRAMTCCETARLNLRAVDTAQAQRIRDKAPSAEDRWAEGYPFEGDLAAIGGFLRATRDGAQPARRRTTCATSTSTSRSRCELLVPPLNPALKGRHKYEDNDM
jgi:hypothetical protein